MKWLKWILIVLAMLLVLVGSAAAIGAFIPLDHSVTVKAVYHQPPEAIWGLITDFPGAPAWRPEIKKVERGEEINGHAVWVEVSDFGEMPLEVAEMDPPRRLVLRIASEDLPFGGTWTFEIAPEPGGASLTITENGQVYNPLFRFMARFVFGYDATMDTYLRALGLRFGEEVQPLPA